ncbi:hypothetical protein RD792_014502 [Penstemon davidsonii]|uniref:Pectinesterase catalytic domain-containing protein n=1 Tax=Penstemon davidsonii TaxID=160366 RepID=A0ABR0CQE9_9LAMI|nr:hypothetical protein RD792_014502 [Penstemon davidsonii]
MVVSAHFPASIDGGPRPVNAGQRWFLRAATSFRNEDSISGLQLKIRVHLVLVCSALFCSVMFCFGLSAPFCSVWAPKFSVDSGLEQPGCYWARFIAQNIKFENTYGLEKQQVVSFMSESDRMVLYRCDIMRKHNNTGDMPHQTTTTYVVVARDATNYCNKRRVIYVKKGVYKEYVEVSKKISNIIITGDGIDASIVFGNHNYVDGWITYRSGTFRVLTGVCDFAYLFEELHEVFVIFVLSLRNKFMDIAKSAKELRNEKSRARYAKMDSQKKERLLSLAREKYRLRSLVMDSRQNKISASVEGNRKSAIRPGSIVTDLSTASIPSASSSLGSVSLGVNMNCATADIQQGAVSDNDVHRKTIRNFKERARYYGLNILEKNDLLSRKRSHAVLNPILSEMSHGCEGCENCAVSCVHYPACLSSAPRNRFEKLTHIPLTKWMLPPEPLCKYCGAFRFSRETAGFCCAGGQVWLAKTVPCPILWFLFTDAISEVAWIYALKEFGQVSHYVNPIDGSPNITSFLQLFFLDAVEQLDADLLKRKDLRSDVMAMLIKALTDNQYTKFFNCIRSWDNLAEAHIVIKTSTSLDQRNCNVPTVDEVAGVWKDGDEKIYRSERDIHVYTDGGRSLRMNYYYSCYDPTQYPLLFPRGEPGWHAGIQKIIPEHISKINNFGLKCTNEVIPNVAAAHSADEIIAAEEHGLQQNKRARNNVSCREYYCYKAQIRRHDNSYLLHSGRLGHQFIIDMYIKLESSRLDYYKLEQFQKEVAKIVQSHAYIIQHALSSAPRNRFEKLTHIPLTKWMLPPEPLCKYCGAFRFSRETAGFCCAGGQVWLAKTVPCPILWFLFTDAISEVACEFRRRVRTYNNAFAFTSIGMSFDPNSWWAREGIYALKVFGQVSHYVNPIDGSPNITSLLQLFFLDAVEQLDADLLKRKDLRSDVMAMLIKALADNQYTKFFKRLRSWDNLAEAHIVIKTSPSLDQRNCNVPIVDEVAGVWKDGDEKIYRSERDIRVYTDGGRSLRMNYYYSCYDPTQYPLLFPRGEPGWHAGIQKIIPEHISKINNFGLKCTNEVIPNVAAAHSADEIIAAEEHGLQQNKRARNNVSCREYYCYKAQIRRHDNSYLLHSGRLGHQFIIDMYIKLESSRLDYYKLEQFQKEVAKIVQSHAYIIQHALSSAPRNRFEKLTHIPLTKWMLPPEPLCKYCGAFRFSRETAGFCCACGQVWLAKTVPCPILWFLFTDAISEVACEFRRRVRTYNNAFAFTSIGMSFDPNSWWAREGIYALKVFGQVSHYVNPIDGSPNITSLLQLFFLDAVEQLDADLLKRKDLRSDVMAMLIKALADNQYTKFFKRLRSWDNLAEAHIVIKTSPSLDQRNCNVPTVDEVAGVWKDGDEKIYRSERDIRVYTDGGRSLRMNYYYSCYDPTQYPLLFPRGEPGWHAGIQKIIPEHISKINNFGLKCTNEVIPNVAAAHSADEIIAAEEHGLQQNKRARNNVSCREYYCYKAQIRRHDNSYLLHSGRLGHQFIIDMYIKLESSRLDYYKLEQFQKEEPAAAADADADAGVNMNCATVDIQQGAVSDNDVHRKTIRNFKERARYYGLNILEKNDLLSRKRSRAVLNPILSEMSHGCEGCENCAVSCVHYPACLSSAPRNRFEKLTHIPLTKWMLPPEPLCKYCGAFRFSRETAGFCCAGGQVWLAKTVPCPILWFLFTDAISEVACEFRRRVRTYNNAFAFTSIGMSFDPNSWWAREGIYALKVFGQVSHYVNPIDGSPNITSLLQLFFLDAVEQLDADLLKRKDLRSDVMAMLIKALADNQYTKFFKRLRSWDNLAEAHIVIKTSPSLDQRNCNVPIVDEVAGVWKDGDEKIYRSERDIRVYTDGGRSLRMNYYYSCYDPTQYPLLFPRGEPGWHAGIQKIIPEHISKINNFGLKCTNEVIPNVAAAHSADEIIAAEEHGSNNLTGVVPISPLPVLEALDLSNNMLSREILQDIELIFSGLKYLDFGGNALTGQVPISIPNMKRLEFLTLA